MEALLSKSKFIGLDKTVWFYSGAETPPLQDGLEAVQRYMLNRSMGPVGRDRNTETEWSLKSNLAKLMHGSPEQIALLSNASEAICSLAQSIPLQPGDNVVLNDLEFPSGVLPWLALKEKGIEVRIVHHEDWTISVDAMMQQVDGRTKLVLASHVSYLSGSRLDYKSLYARLQQTGALLILDVTQSLGAVEVDIRHTDVLVCSSYKWLLSVHGLGILAFNSQRASQLSSSLPGWRSVVDLFSDTRFDHYLLHPDARKFELGYPSYPSVYAMNASTALLLEIGIDRIERHIEALGGELIQRMQAKGFTVRTPVEGKARAGNISIYCPDGEAVAKRLYEQGVYLWGGDGRIRASVHLFNDSQDVDRLIELLPDAESFKSNSQ